MHPIPFSTPLAQGEIDSLKRDSEIFSGHPAPAAKRPQRQLSERRQARVLPLQRSEEVQGRKKILSAKGTIFPALISVDAAKHKTSVAPAETKGVLQDELLVGMPCPFGHAVQINGGIRAVVDRR